MSVGRFSKEEDYIESRKKELNFKAPGTGDKWAIAWVDDRKSQFEPKFLELFNKESNCIGGSKPEAKYTMIIHTSFSEPGYNLGPFPGGRKNASINADVTIVETADRSRSICTITIDGAPGRGGLGYDFDTGFRIQECYAVCGKRLSTMINKIKK